MKGYIFIEAYSSGNIFGYSTPKRVANWALHVFTSKDVHDIHYSSELITLIKNSLNDNNVQLKTRNDMDTYNELKSWQQGTTKGLKTWREELNSWRDILHVDLDENQYYWRSQPSNLIKL